MKQTQTSLPSLWRIVNFACILLLAFEAYTRFTNINIRLRRCSVFVGTCGEATELSADKKQVIRNSAIVYMLLTLIAVYCYYYKNVTFIPLLLFTAAVVGDTVYYWQDRGNMSWYAATWTEFFTNCSMIPYLIMLFVLKPLMRPVHPQ